MIKNKLNWVLTAAIAVAAPIFAQQEQMYTHYDFNSLAMNPAYAGSKRTLVASALNRTQWATYPGAPNYQSLAVHSPVSQAPAFRDFAVGLNLQTGKIGKFAVASPFAETEIAANIAYHKEIARNLRLAVGLRVGAFNYAAELSKLQLQNPGDVTFKNNDYSITAPMTGFGVYLYSDKYFAAVSAPRMVFISEKTAPSGSMSFESYTKDNKLNIGDLNVGDRIAIWIKRTPKNVGGAGSTKESLSIIVEGAQ